MHRTKLALLAGSSLCLGMGFAHAADMPVRPLIAKAPILDPWTGVYVGGNIGYSWGRTDHATSVSPFIQDPGGAFFTFAFPGGTSSSTLRPVGPIAGGQIGYTGWIAPRWLAGLEGDFQWSGEKNSQRSAFSGATTDCTSGDCSFTGTTDITARLSYFGTVRTRIGPELNGVWVYATGGLAYGKVSFEGVNNLVLVNNVAAAVVGTYSTAFSYSRWLYGYTIGVGAEGLIDAAGKWRWKLEYLHIDLGSIGGAAGVGSAPFVTSRSTTSFTDDIIRVGLNYRLTGGP